MVLFESSKTGSKISFKGAHILILEPATLSLALLLRLKSVCISFTASIGESRALTCFGVKEICRFIFSARSLLHWEIANINTSCYGTQPSWSCSLLAPVFTKLHGVKLIAITLAPSIVEGEASIIFLVIPKLLHIAIAGSNYLWKLTKILSLKAG